MIKNILKVSSILVIIGGAMYILIQFVHPLDQLNSVPTALYKVVGILTSIMSLIIGLGILGIGVSISDRPKPIGVISVIIWGFFWIISMMFSFIEVSILPLLVEKYPEFVAGMTGLFSSYPTTANLGLFPLLTTLSGITYILGGILYGSYMLNIKSIPKFNGLLLIIASILTVGASAVPHPYDRGFAIPMGVALIFLGFNLLKRKSDYVKISS